MHCPLGHRLRQECFHNAQGLVRLGNRFLPVRLDAGESPNGVDVFWYDYRLIVNLIREMGLPFVGRQRILPETKEYSPYSHLVRKAIYDSGARPVIALRRAPQKQQCHTGEIEEMPVDVPYVPKPDWEH